MGQAKVCCRPYQQLCYPLADAATKFRVLDDPRVVKLAKELDITPARLLIQWAVKRNTVVLPKSVTPERIIDNLKGN
jgi:diketogulonate reductase-like aldo/keto reductase